jgi:hypothetical protein
MRGKVGVPVASPMSSVPARESRGVRPIAGRGNYEPRGLVARATSILSAVSVPPMIAGCTHGRSRRRSLKAAVLVIAP